MERSGMESFPQFPQFPQLSALWTWQSLRSCFAWFPQTTSARIPNLSQADQPGPLLLTTVLSEPSALQLYPVDARGHIVGHGTSSREVSWHEPLT